MKTHRISLSGVEHKPIVLNQRRAIVLPVDAYPVGALLELHNNGGKVFRIVTDIDVLQQDLAHAVYSLRPLQASEKFQKMQEGDK